MEKLRILFRATSIVYAWVYANYSALYSYTSMDATHHACSASVELHASVELNIMLRASMQLAIIENPSMGSGTCDSMVMVTTRAVVVMHAQSIYRNVLNACMHAGSCSV